MPDNGKPGMLLHTQAGCQSKFNQKKRGYKSRVKSTPKEEGGGDKCTRRIVNHIYKRVNYLPFRNKIQQFVRRSTEIYFAATNFRNFTSLKKGNISTLCFLIKQCVIFTRKSTLIHFAFAYLMF